MIRLAALLLCLLAYQAHAQFALVQHAQEVTDDFSSDTTVIVDGASDTALSALTTGNLVVVVTFFERGSRTVTGITGGATYAEQVELNAASNPNLGLSIWAGIATSAATSITVTASGTTDFNNDQVDVFEFSGPASPIDVIGSDELNISSAGTTHNVAGTLTPTNTEALFVGAITFSGSPGTLTQESGFTVVSNESYYVFYRSVSGSPAAQGFSNASTTARTSNVIFTGFEGAVAGGSVLPIILQQH
jgi:hypothetical protein